MVKKMEIAKVKDQVQEARRIIKKLGFFLMDPDLTSAQLAEALGHLTSAAQVLLPTLEDNKDSTQERPE